MYREGWQRFDLVLVKLQEHGIIARLAHCRKGDDHIFLSPQMPFSHHQMGNMTVLRIDHEFIDFANKAVCRLNTGATAYSFHLFWNLK